MISELIQKASLHAAFRFQGSCETTERLHMHLLPSFTGHALALGAISVAGTALDFVETECVIEACGPHC